ncbi:uncharacterized protein JCM15063_001122 [Sporobolomyces koalae]|uniref:uncharacterized protein n=1 Tax=Sporobolomyces koalae TaxID=500713 RepID=UPI0031779674
MSASSFPQPSPSSTLQSPAIDAVHAHSSAPHVDSTPYSATATPSSSYYSQTFNSPAQANPDELPKLGSIRCYWTILSPALDYVYLDPLLEEHLGDFASSFLGSNLLDFVHPDEREQLAEDLLPRPDRIAGVETAGVFGSVTRLRYSRLVGILRKLGCLDVPTLPDADKYALDEDYLNLDLTTSWIAGNGIIRGHTSADGSSNMGNGAVLAFFHVVGDKDQVKNNDLLDRGDWTNWCGIKVDEHRYFTPARAAALIDVLENITAYSSRPSTSGGSFEEDSKSALLASLHGLSSETTDGPPPHVFQILDRSGKALVSFPTCQDNDGRKRYETESYAALAREVVARPRGAANAKTSCTKRYRSKHPVMKDSILTTIESVVIMYGSITFACFQTGGIYLTSARKAALGLSKTAIGPTPGSTANDFNLEDVPATATEFLPSIKKEPGLSRDSVPRFDCPSPKRIKLEQTARSTFLPLRPKIETSSATALSISTAQPRGMYRPSIESEYGANGGISPTVASASAILGSISSGFGDPASNRRTHQTEPITASAYSATPPGSTSTSMPPFRPSGTTPSSIYPPSYSIQSTSPYAAPHTHAHAHGYFPPHPTAPARPDYPSTSRSTSFDQTEYPKSEAADYPSHAERPPPAERTASSTTVLSLNAISEQQSASTDASETKEGKKSRLRPEGPVFKPGIKACESCGIVESPEWRKGPSGAKSLCNACGLRYARSVNRQKKLAERTAGVSGPVTTKKKKGKAMPTQAPNHESNSSAMPYDATTAATSMAPLPVTSSAPAVHESGFSQAEAPAVHHAYTPYYSTGPTLSSSYALVAANAPASSGPPVSSVSAYPASSSGYYPATTAYPHSTYAPTMTHIPIHHTLAATLAPVTAPVSIHTHGYPHSEPMPTSMPHSPATSSYPATSLSHAFSHSAASTGVYTHATSARVDHIASTSGEHWRPTYTSSEIHSSTSVAPPSLNHARLAPIGTSPSGPSSAYLAPSSYQPYQPWHADHNSNPHHPGSAGETTAYESQHN